MEVKINQFITRIWAYYTVIRIFGWTAMRVIFWKVVNGFLKVILGRSE
jgi:hypothetical protein